MQREHIPGDGGDESGDGAAFTPSERAAPFARGEVRFELGDEIARGGVDIKMAFARDVHVRAFKPQSGEQIDDARVIVAAHEHGNDVHDLVELLQLGGTEGVFAAHELRLLRQPDLALQSACLLIECLDEVRAFIADFLQSGLVGGQRGFFLLQRAQRLFFEGAHIRKIALIAVDQLVIERKPLVGVWIGFFEHGELGLKVLHLAHCGLTVAKLPLSEALSQMAEDFLICVRMTELFWRCAEAELVAHAFAEGLKKLRDLRTGGELGLVRGHLREAGEGFFRLRPLFAHEGAQRGIEAGPAACDEAVGLIARDFFKLVVRRGEIAMLQHLAPRIVEALGDGTPVIGVHGDAIGLRGIGGDVGELLGDDAAAALAAFAEQPSKQEGEQDARGGGADESRAAGDEPATDAALIEQTIREAQFLDHGIVIREALLRIEAEHVIDHVLGARGEAQAAVSQLHAAAFDAAQLLDAVRVRLMRRAAGQRVEKRGAEAEDVAAVILLVLQDLFRRDIVGRGPNFRAFVRSALGEEGETEVHDLRGAAFGEKDVRGLHIAMDQAEVLRGAQSLGDLMADAQCIAFRELAFLADAAFEAAAANEFHGEVKVTLVMAHGVELDHVRMRDAGRDERLLAKLLQTLRIAAVAAVQDLQSNAAAERFVLRLEHAAHAALADLPHDHEMIETTTHTDHLTAKRALQLRERLQRRHVDG